MPTNEHGMEYWTRIEREHRELVGALILAREAIAGFPHSMGYQHTHLPKIDAVLARVKE